MTLENVFMIEFMHAGPCFPHDLFHSNKNNDSTSLAVVLLKCTNATFYSLLAPLLVLLCKSDCLGVLNALLLSSLA